eukprot:6324893-Prymnesium_polylepis.2
MSGSTLPKIRVLAVFCVEELLKSALVTRACADFMLNARVSRHGETDAGVVQARHAGERREARKSR